MPSLTTIPAVYVPNNKQANTYQYYGSDTVTLNTSANRFQFFKPNVTNSQPWYFWFRFDSGGEADARTLLSWIKQVNYFEKWFRGNNEAIVLNYKITITDPTKWYLGGSSTMVMIKQEYVEMTNINIPNGIGDENPTCMLVPFK